MNISELTDWRSWINYRNKRFWLLCFVALYSLIGFILIPWLIRTQLPDIARGPLGAEASVEKVTFNPWTLQLRARNFRLASSAGEDLLLFDGLHLNLQIRSLVRFALVFRLAELSGPHLFVTREKSGDINLLRLLQPAGGPQGETPPAEEDSEPLRLIIDELNISSGRATLRDETRPAPFTTDLGPINITLADLSTLPEDPGRQKVNLELENGSRLSWSGSLQLNPLDSSGSVEISGSPLPLLYRYLAERLAFDFDNCCLELTFNYAIGTTPEGSIAARIGGLNGAFRDVEVRSPETGELVVRLPTVRLAGGTFQWPGARATLAELAFDQPELNVWRTADAKLNLQQLAGDPGASQDEMAPDAAADTSDETSWPIAVQIDSLSVNGMKAAFSDRMLDPSADITLEQLNLLATALSTQEGSQSPLSIDASLASGGSLSLKGDVELVPNLQLQATLAVDALSLRVVQPWVQELARIRIDDGVLNIDAELATSPAEALGFRGNVAINTLRIHDSVEDKPLLGWQSLAIDELRLGLSESELEASRIRLDGPYGRVVINTAGSTNFAALAVGDDTTTDAETAGNATAEVKTGTSAPWVIRVGQSVVSDGRMDFTDLSLPLPFKADIREFGGKIGSFASNSSRQSELDLKGSVGEYGVATIGGGINLLSPTDDAAVLVRFRNVAMPDLSPYTAEFAGRRIESGKLDLDLDYRFEKRVMQGKNKMVLKDFSLGEKVDSPDALDLPLGLAVALLRDVNGVIDLELGVSGDLDDPQFSASGIILKAFANLITRLVAAPFRLLGSLVPGADKPDFDSIGFAAGSAELSPPEREKLQQLATAMQQRPALLLDVPGGFDRSRDVPALQSGEAEALVETLLGDDQNQPGEQLLRRTRRALETLAEERALFGESSARELRQTFARRDESGDEQFDEVAYMAELRQRLADSIVIDAAGLESLASARQQAIIDNLVAAGLDDRRVQAGSLDEGRVKGDEVRLKLGLSVDSAVTSAGSDAATS